MSSTRFEGIATRMIAYLEGAAASQVTEIASKVDSFVKELKREANDQWADQIRHHEHER